TGNAVCPRLGDRNRGVPLADDAGERAIWRILVNFELLSLRNEHAGAMDCEARLREYVPVVVARPGKRLRVEYPALTRDNAIGCKGHRVDLATHELGGIGVSTRLARRQTPIGRR